MTKQVTTLEEFEDTHLGATNDEVGTVFTDESTSPQWPAKRNLFVLVSKSARQLRALYWKDYIVCKWKRHYIVSMFELFLLFIVVVTVVHDLDSITWDGPNKYPELIPIKSIDFKTAARSRLKRNISTIAYAPRTFYTDTILYSAFGDATPPPKFFGFHSADDFDEQLEREDGTEFLLAVVFDERTAKGILPYWFNYTLRFNATHYNLHTTQKFTKSSYGPRSKFVTNEEILLLWPSMNALFKSHLEFYKLHLNESDLSPYIKYFPTIRYSAIVSVRLENIGFVISIGCSYFLLFFMLRVARNKQKRTKEFLHIVGVPDFVYWTNLFLVGFTTKAILMVMAWFLVCLPVFGRALYHHSNELLVLIIFLLYGVNIILQALLLAVIFNSPPLGVIATLMVSFISMVFSRQLSDPDLVMSRWETLRWSILPEVSLELACNIIASWERAGIGAHWSNISEMAEESGTVSLLCAITMTVISCVLHIFLIFYLDAVLPWQTDNPRHPLFIFSPSYWCPALIDESLSDTSSASDPESSDSELNAFEKVSPFLGSPIVEFRHVTHEFGWRRKDRALDDFSLKLYRNQISIIIGPNGAGKTTAMNLLAGLFQPTAGGVYIDGMKIGRAVGLTRESVGLCPQQNFLFEDLTVEEHLRFFSRIRGADDDHVKAEIDRILREVTLDSKSDQKAGHLSQGSKRKLCIANAMIGGSTILILDEPTTGLDPEGRKKIWSILEKARNNRTIVMTTHFMDEADVLGDRVALITRGKLKCVGSPCFLKRTYESGCKLRGTKSSPSVDVDPILQIVKGHLGRDQVHLTSDIGLEFCISLGSPQTADLVQLFRDLEESRTRLGIASLDASVSNMEDVFLKVAELDERKYSEGTTDDPTTSTFLQCDRETCFALYSTQFSALFVKRFRVLRRQWWMPVCLVILPAFLGGYVALTTQAIIDLETLPEPNLLNYSFISLSAEEVLEGFIGSSQKDEKTSALKLSMEQDGIRVNQFYMRPLAIEDHLLTLEKSNPLDFKKHWRLGYVRNTSIVRHNVLWFNAEPYHVGAAALARWQTAVLIELAGRVPNDGANQMASVGVSVSNHPLPNARMSKFSYFRVVYIRVSVMLLIQLATTLLISPIIVFPVEERVSKSKLMQRMTGVHWIIFFVTPYIFDLIVLFFCSFVMTVVMAIYNPAESFEMQLDASFSIMFLLMEYGFTMVKVAYVLALWFKSPWTGLTTMVAGNALIAGVIVPIIAYISALGDFDKAGPILNFVPQFAVVWGFSNIQLNIHSRKICESLSDATLRNFCMSPLRVDACCRPCPNATFSPEPLYCYEHQSSYSVASKQVYGLFIVGAGASAIIFILEGCLQCCTDAVKWIRRTNTRIAHQTLDDDNTQFEDTDVINEQKLVSDAVNCDDRAGYALLVHDLVKEYRRFTFRAVDHVSFSVKKNECFGLLGVNGAGKTTLFGMLTGDLTMSDGNAYIGDYDLRSSLCDYQSCVGFCPEVDGLLANLTGKEMLELFCGLRGVKRSQVSSIIAQMVALADLEPHAKELTSTYSVGNKRKLAIALAMIGNPPVLCLDEPTSGIDPTARRKIWSMLVKTQRELGTSIVLSSHSMDECEALCDRMAIMVNGRFMCLGSAQHLKQKYAGGYTLAVKIKPGQRDTETIEDVCSLMHRLFPRKNQLTDLHQNTLTYYVTDSTLRWSELFEVVKELHEQFDLEDAVASDTSLEQVFLAFAATQLSRPSSTITS